MKKKEKETSLFSERGLGRNMAKVSVVLAAGVFEQEKRAALFRKIAARELMRPSTWKLTLGERLDHKCWMCGSETMWECVVKSMGRRIFHTPRKRVPQWDFL
jgi:hypothetical protein